LLNYYDIKAKEKERQFLKKCKEGFFYFTGKGRKNWVVQVTKQSVHVSTEGSKSPFRISRYRLRKAISFFLLKRTVIRKDLESYSNFSSSLLGLLRMIFSEVSKIQRTVNGLLRLTLKGVRFLFSGVPRSPGDMELIQQNNGKWVLLSYYHLRDDPQNHWLDYLTRFDLRMVFDSGEFSLWNAREKGLNVPPITVEDYAAFVRKHEKYIDAYFTLDRVGDPVMTRFNQRYLTQHVGRPPIPIWHVQSDWTELDQIVFEDHEVIGIGGSVKIRSEEKKRTIFQEMFRRYPNQNFHCLGLSSALLWEFEWFSRNLHGFTVHNVKKLSHSLINLLSLCIFKMHKLN